MHEHRMGSGGVVKVYESQLEGPNKRGWPLGRWMDRVEEYLGERGVNGRGMLEEVGRECWDRERCVGMGRGEDFCRGHP